MKEDKMIQKYIQEKSEYIFNKYIYSKFLMTKYYRNFGKLEVEKLTKVYDLFTLDRKIQYRFLSQAIGERTNENFAQAEAQYEFKDAIKQIRRLNIRNKFSEKNFDILSEAINQDIKNKIKKIVRNIDPVINPNLKDHNIYQNFIKDMKAMEFNSLDYLISIPEKYEKSKSLNSEKKIDFDLLEKIIINIASKNSKMKSEFPFILEEVLMSQEKIDSRKKELEKQIDTTTKSIDRLSYYYIMSKEEGVWRS